MALTKSFIRNAAMAPLDARLMNMAQVAANADGSPRTGVLGSANVSIVSTLATMNVAVAAAEFVTSKGKSDGVSIFTNDGVVNVAIGAAPASNSRIDVIWVKHNDDTTGDANALPVFGVTAGTAAASPTKPAIPTGALELATLRVYAGTTATNGGSNTLVNTYQMTAMRGGLVPFRTLADLLAWTTPAEGQLAGVVGQSRPYQRTGGAWQRTDGIIIPSSVVGGTLNEDGGVSFSGVGAVTLNGVFSSIYRSYLVKFSIDSRTVLGGTGGEGLRLAAAGTPAAAANYGWKRLVLSGTTVSNAANASDVAWFGSSPNVSGASDKVFRIERPAAAVPTRIAMMGTSTDTDIANVDLGVAYAGYHTLATAYDGLTLYVPAGAMTGQISVQGII